jgi:RNA polymerase sigma-70 factor (family 1)
MTRLNSKSDTDLLKLLADGEKTAFEVLYNRHWSVIYRLARKILEDNEVAKDVVQEAFISLYENALKKEIRDVQAYLFQAAKFQCFMQLRAGKISEKHLARITRIISSNCVEEDFEAEELQSNLNHQIAALPDKCREVFYLSRFESLPNKKIAEKLNISHKTVENQISKALKTLRLSLDKLMVLVLINIL